MLLHFFGYVSIKRNWLTGIIDEPRKQLSFNHVAGFKSAIVWNYKQQNKRLREDTSSAIGQCLQGYKRQVAKFKQTNVMKMQEGKFQIGFLSLCRYIYGGDVTDRQLEESNLHKLNYLTLYDGLRVKNGVRTRHGQQLQLQN